MHSPLRIEQCRVGMRVQCIHQGGHDRYGKIATIMEIINGLDTRITVVWEDGWNSNLIWSYASSFEAVIPEDKKEIPLTDIEMHVGLKVRCLYPALYGEKGKINYIKWGRTGMYFTVAWDDPKNAEYKTWYDTFHFARQVPKKYSHISSKKLRKLEREQMKAKAFLNTQQDEHEK